MKDSTVISLTREEAQAIWDNSPRAKARRLSVGDLLINLNTGSAPHCFRVVEVIGASLSADSDGGGFLRVKTVWHEFGTTGRTTRPSFAHVDGTGYKVYTPLPVAAPVKEKRPSEYIADSIRELSPNTAENYLRAEAILSGEKPIDIWCTLNNIYDEVAQNRGATIAVLGEMCDTNAHYLKSLLEIAQTNQQTQAAILGELCALRQIWEGGKK
jgi:hypothetical protein